MALNSGSLLVGNIMGCQESKPGLCTKTNVPNAQPVILLLEPLHAHFYVIYRMRNRATKVRKRKKYDYKSKADIKVNTPL